MLQAQRRWCLTGTPIQNKLQDFGSLLKFLGVGPAENDRWFHQKVVKPIQDKDPKGMERLRILVCAYCLRRTKTILEDPLPGNVSLIRDVILNEDERRIYDACKKDTVRSIDKAVSAGVKGSGVGKIQLLQILGQVCNHGMDLLSPERRAQIYDYLPSSFQYPFNMQAQEQFQRESYVNAINIPEIQVHDPMEIDVHDQTVHYRGPSSKVKALIQNIRNDQQDINGSVKRFVYLSSSAPLSEVLLTHF